MNPFPRAKHEVRALFFDLDGTLVSFATHRIPASAMQALRRAHDAGYMLFAATGRHITEVWQIPQIGTLPWDGILSANGQYCQLGEELVYIHPLPREDVLKLAVFLEENPDMPCLFATADRQYLSGVNDVVRRCHAAVATDLPPIAPLSACLNEPIYHMGLYLKGAPPPILDQLAGCAYARWGDRGELSGIDLIAKDGGKWTGITRMAERLGLAENQLMVFGDGDNDVDMLRRAVYSVAIAGNCKEAIDAAGYVAPGVEQDGVAAALRDILEIPL